MNPLSPRHPLWLAGFRPFFLLACAAGILMPLLWGLFFSGHFALPPGINAFQWHAHEMLYGFGGAVLIGFLLTASKNWVKIRGVHGAFLMTLCALWIFERGFIFYSPAENQILKHLGHSLFLLASGLYIIWSLMKHRQNDSFKDNYFFIFLLTMIVVSKNLLISEFYYQHGIAMSLGLFRLAFAVMFERTMTQFMKSTENASLYRNTFLDLAIKVLIAVCVFQSFLPVDAGAIILTAAGTLLLVRWLIWKPWIGFKKFGNAVMYLGYFGLILHMYFEALKIKGIWSLGAYSTHVFTFLCMGVIIPGMLVRISKGHTGHKPGFSLVDKIPIILVLAAAIFRLVLPLIFPQLYTTWILISGILWSLGFLALGFRILPFVLKPRIDGKIH